MNTKDFNLTAHDLVEELKLLLDGLYEGTLTSDDTGVTVKFINGQTFKFSVEEIK